MLRSIHAAAFLCLLTSTNKLLGSCPLTAIECSNSARKRASQMNLAATSAPEGGKTKGGSASSNEQLRWQLFWAPGGQERNTTGLSCAAVLRVAHSHFIESYCRWFLFSFQPFVESCYTRTITLRKTPPPLQSTVAKLA